MQRHVRGRWRGAERDKVGAQECPRLLDINLIEDHDALLVLAARVVIAWQICQSPHIGDRLLCTWMEGHDASKDVTHRLQLKNVIPKPLRLNRALLPGRCRRGKVLELVAAKEYVIDVGCFDEDKERGEEHCAAA